MAGTPAQVTPVTEDEIEILLRSDVRALGRDPVAVRSLLNRMGATLRAHTRTVRRLQGDVELAAAASRATKTPLAAAVEALGRLSVDEQRQVFDVHASALLDRLGVATADAHRVKLAAASEANRVRLVLAQLEEDPALDETVRSRVRAHRQALPAPVAEGGTAAVSPALPAAASGFTVPAAACPPEDGATVGDPDGLAGLFDS